jgi:hypothetical protein
MSVNTDVCNRIKMVLNSNSMIIVESRLSDLNGTEGQSAS